MKKLQLLPTTCLTSWRGQGTQLSSWLRLTPCISLSTAPPPHPAIPCTLLLPVSQPPESLCLSGVSHPTIETVPVWISPHYPGCAQHDARQKEQSRGCVLKSTEEGEAGVGAPTRKGLGKRGTEGRGWEVACQVEGTRVQGDRDQALGAGLKFSWPG